MPDTLGDYVGYAMPIVVYRAVAEGERKFSPAEVESAEVVPVCGNPDTDRIRTSIIERSNLSLRMASAGLPGSQTPSGANGRTSGPP